MAGQAQPRYGAAVARSNTPSDLNLLCVQCWQREGCCLCADIPRIHNRTELLVLRHAKEFWRVSNTARIASLALERCELLEVGGRADDRLHFEERVAEFLAREGRTYLLYPGTGTPLARVAESGGPIRLIIPDGSWRQARRMLLRVPGVAALPRVSFGEDAAAGGPALRLRRPPHAGGLSTIEAIARALEALEGEEVSRPLDEVYRKMVERTFWVRQRCGIAEAARRREKQCRGDDPVAG